jgi:hypothetical protein
MYLRSIACFPVTEMAKAPTNVFSSSLLCDTQRTQAMYFSKQQLQQK